MAGGHSNANEMQFKGIEKYINSYTLRGRLHGAYASIVIWAGIFLTARYFIKKPKAVEKK